MLNTRDLGRLFVTSLDPERIRPETPLLHLAPSWEMEPPFRESPLTVVLRPNWLLRRGLVVGWWRDTEIETVEQQELNMGMISAGDLMDRLSEEDKQKVRKHIAETAKDVDEEHELMLMMDLL